ncbi:MAG: hypothetical protein JSU59_04455 [Nitrospirota bacterium]|nr:MAG: hypothetical protein JSU59_04455 [Nitrospirota bacterium]
MSKVVLVCTIWSLLIVPHQSGLAQDEKESFLQQSQQAGEFLKEIYEKGEYEAWETRRASEILSPQLISGPYHEVEETVESQGPLSIFKVQSTFGPFEVKGEAMLRRLIKEIYALAVLQDTTRTEAFQKGLKEAGSRPLVLYNNLVAHPVATLSAVPEGLATFVAGSVTAVKANRTEYEDRYLEAALVVSRYKRKYATQLGIDVYTTNPVLQKEMNRLGWAAALGDWTPSLVTLPFSAPIITVYKTSSFSQSLINLLSEETPGTLWNQNNELLKEMGIREGLRESFLNHLAYSPRHKTVIVRSLATMEKTRNRHRVIELALPARTENDALSYQQIVEMLAGHHRMESPIEEIVVYRGLPLGYAKNGTLLFGFPVDYGRWVPFSDYLMRGFAHTRIESKTVRARKLWITGKLSPKAKKEIMALNITAKEEVDQKIGMID